MTQTGIPGIFGGYTPRKTIPSNQVQNQSWYSWGSPAGVQKQPQTTTVPATQQSAGTAVATGEGYSFPDFTVDLEGIWNTAGLMADNEINPQLAEIDRLLLEAGYTADESQRAIAEAYPLARRSLQKSIYENMVAGEGSLAAMGTGRGGGRQELAARAGEREATGIESIENQKQREVGAINRALSQYKEKMGTTRTGLVGNRGALQASYAEQIRGNRFNEAGIAYNAALGKASLQQNADQFNKSLASGGSGTPNTVFDLYGGTGGTNYQLTKDDINTLLGIKALPPPKNQAKGQGWYSWGRPRGY